MNSTKKASPNKSNSLKKTHKACVEKNILRDELKSMNVMFNNKKRDCDDEIYSTISKFFNSKQSSTEDLIRALLEYYKLEKDKNIDYVLTFREFVMLFPRDSSVKDTNFKRQHVFEALCRVILFYNYDNNTFSNKKIFYKSLEKYIDNPKNTNIVLEIDDIKKEKINSGSAAQSVDIFFKIPKETLIKEEPITNACERDYKKTTTSISKDKDTYILIQNKFYSDEYSSADKYDINKIYQRASKLNNPTSESEIKIILMVNNAKLLDEKIKKSRNKDMGLVSKIYGLEELEDWFQNMLYDLYINGLDILNDKSTTMKTILQLRFHQKLFINTTYKYFTNEIISQRRKKFIWGAVPRSGKSYIIAGMIEKLNSNNNILLILGAKTETLEQFKKMFSTLEKFTDYNIITTPSENKTAVNTKNIFIFSQEKIKINKKSQSLDFDIKFKEDYSKLFEIKKLDIYFDEVHKGGSTKMSQEKIIDTFFETNFTIDIFVMVTATYAKPTIAYTNIKIDNNDPLIINWSYMDQQNMKEITNIRIKDEIINSRKNSIEKEVLQELFNEYNIKYGEDYLSILEEQYKKHPELVIIQPTLSIKIPESLKTKETSGPFILSGNIFKLKCSAMGKNLSMMRNPNDIFANNDSVIDLIKFIGAKESYYFSTNTIYGYLHYKLKYDFSNKHSQIWFLPDNNLYEDPTKCKQELTKTNSEDKIIDGSEENNDGLPNIEPLTRGLVLNLLNNEYFTKYFCFLIVHGQKLKYYGKNYSKEEIFPTQSVNISSLSFEKGKSSINEIIQAAERNAYKENKSLIILTGSMLRLGVSLPCVDIAINFDTVSSMDLNYQTMFRVLTERKDKKYGYYIDLNYERGKNFLYEFNENYGKGFANSNSIDDLTNNIQSLLLLFNYNGLNLINASSLKEVDLYNKLIKELKLSKEEYMNHYKGNNKKILEKVLLSIGDLKVFDKIKKYIFTGTDANKSKSNIKITLTNKTKQKTQYLQPDETEETEEKEKVEEKEEGDKDAGELQVKDIADLLSTYTSMLAIFSDKNNANCSSLDECIDKTINDVSEKVNPFDCSYEGYNVFGSYINLIKKLNPKQFVKSLELYKELINSDENKTLKNALVIFFDNIREVMKEDKLIEVMKKDKQIFDMTPSEIQQKIEQYLPVRDAEKNEFGEVFTPTALIEEMLDKLPKEVWKNKDYKWLDPANGIGNYPMVAYRRLMEGLKDEIKDNKKRSEHIIKNMLYMFEINPKNVGVSRKIFGHDANIFCNDFLKSDIEKICGVKKFDVIMGNPPYNISGVGRQSKTNIDDEFIEKSLQLLNTKGFLLFITKTHWRCVSKIHKILENMFLMYSKSYNFNNNPFKGQNMLVNWFIIQNIKSTKDTEFDYNNKKSYGKIPKNMNIYFAYRDYLTYLHELILLYGNMSKVTRNYNGPKVNEYLMIPHAFSNTKEIHITNIYPKTEDKYYIIASPNYLMKHFIKGNIFKDMLSLGRFTGYATSKNLFNDIPNFNNVKQKDEQNKIIKNLEKFSKNINNSTRKIRSLPNIKTKTKKTFTIRAKTLGGKKTRTRKLKYKK